VKILYHHRTLGDGAEGIHVSSIANALRAIGHEVKIASVIGEQTNVTNQRTRVLTPIVRALPRALYELMELGYSAVGYQALNRHIAAWQPDFIYERYTLFNMAGVLAARRSGLPLLLEFNAPLAYERAQYERLRLKRLARHCEVRICSQADAVIVVSTPLKQYLVEQGVAADRIVVMPNGADPARFRPDAESAARVRASHGIPQDAVVAGFSGILRPWHGVDLMLRAIAGVRTAGAPVHGLIVGDGPSLQELQRLAAELGIAAHVTFTGRVAHDEMPRQCAAFDIGISPRATFYASPMKVPEYMATGVAVIAPRMPNLTDLIADGVDGDLFEPEAVEDLQATLQRLVVDASRRRRIAAAARQSIVNTRTWTHNAARIVELGAPSRRCA
jgi:glycosyltransferase involved in cell wall biosynthesis